MSVFLQSIDIRSNSFQNYDPNKTTTVLDIALKVIATATVFTPITIGCYEYFRARTANQLENSGIHSNSYIGKIAWTVVTLSLNIFYYGIHELWARYPTRYLEQFPKGSKINIKDLYSYQVSEYLKKTEVIPRLNNIEIEQCVYKNPHISGPLFRKLPGEHFNDYVFDLIDHKKDSIPSLPDSILQSLGEQLASKATAHPIRVITKCLPPSRLVDHPAAEIFLHSMNPKDFFQKFEGSRKSWLSFLFTPPFERAIQQCSDDQKIRLLQHFLANPDKKKGLSYKTINTLLQTPLNRKVRRDFYEALNSLQRSYLKKHHGELVFSLKSNKELLQLAPKNQDEQEPFLENFAINQLKEMNCHLFKSLYWSLLKRPDILKQVGIPTINEYISSYGFEKALIDALPREMFQNLNVSEAIFCLRKTERDITIERKQEWELDGLYDVTKSYTSTYVSFVPCSGFEGLLRFIHDDFKEIEITNKTFLPEYPFDVSLDPFDDSFSSSRSCYNPLASIFESETETYNLHDKFNATWAPQVIKRTLLGLSDEQIHRMVWRHVPPTLCKEFIHKLLNSVSQADAIRHLTLKQLFDYTPGLTPPLNEKDITESFKTLGLSRGCNRKEAKKAFNQLSRQHHPDKGGDKDKFVKISAAWQILENHFTSR